MMDKLDPHSLFSLFEKGDEEVYKEHGFEDVLENPFVLMNMVLKGVEAYELMAIMFERNYPEQFERQESKIKYKYYNKLYGYLASIHLKSIEGVYSTGDSYERTDILNVLDHLRTYFEGLEEYEKCAVILQYRDLIFDEEISDLFN